MMPPRLDISQPV